MIINESDLKGTDYKISKSFNKQIYSFSELLNDMASNEYSRLENYYKDKFEFIKFKDEEVIVLRNPFLGFEPKEPPYDDKAVTSTKYFV